MRFGAAAALVLAATLLPAAASAKSCLGKAPDGSGDPATFDALRACQAAQRKAFIKASADKTGRAPGAAALDRFDDGQRADVTTYMSRHTVDGGSAAGDEKQPASGAAAQAGSESDSGQAGASQAELDALKRDMLDKSEGGKKGMTPEIADELRQYLLKKQGSVSPDMQDLLNSTAHDGANLSADTMQKLRSAGKQAKAQGLDLGIDPGVEKQLLQGDITPAAGPGQPGTN